MWIARNISKRKVWRPRGLEWGPSRVGLGRLGFDCLSCTVFAFRISRRNTGGKSEVRLEGRIGVGMGSECLGFAGVFQRFYKIIQTCVRDSFWSCGYCGKCEHMHAEDINKTLPHAYGKTIYHCYPVLFLGVKACTHATEDIFERQILQASSKDVFKDVF